MHNINRNIMIFYLSDQITCINKNGCKIRLPVSIKMIVRFPDYRTVEYNLSVFFAINR